MAPTRFPLENDIRAVNSAAIAPAKSNDDIAVVDWVMDVTNVEAASLIAFAIAE